MKKYAIKRILQLIPILFAITFLSYGMTRIARKYISKSDTKKLGRLFPIKLQKRIK